MPRALKISSQDIQRARRDWYAFHYEKRAKFLAMPLHEQHIYQNAVFRISPPALTIYGGLPEGYPGREDLQILMKTQGLQDTDLCNPWYVSDAGWADFQRSWQQLPEPLDLPTATPVQKYPLVHIVHNPDDLSPRRRS